MTEAARRRRPAEGRALLVRAASEVFARKGYAQATTDDIAEEARGAAGGGERMGLTIRLALGMVACMAVFDGFLPPGLDRPSREELLEHMSDVVLYGLRRAPCPGQDKAV